MCSVMDYLSASTLSLLAFIPRHFVCPRLHLVVHVDACFLPTATTPTEACTAEHQDSDDNNLVIVQTQFIHRLACRHVLETGQE